MPPDGARSSATTPRERAPAAFPIRPGPWRSLNVTVDPADDRRGLLNLYPHDRHAAAPLHS
jgi:hypothetical protein